MKSLVGIVAVAAGEIVSLAIKDDGTVWAWGSNGYGQLGNGSADNWSYVPVQATGLTDIIAIAANGHISTALKKDGTVWAWGDNYAGLGNGSDTHSNVPIQVSSLTEYNCHCCRIYFYACVKR